MTPTNRIIRKSCLLESSLIGSRNAVIRAYNIGIFTREVLKERCSTNLPDITSTVQGR